MGGDPSIIKYVSSSVAPPSLRHAFCFSEWDMTQVLVCITYEGAIYNLMPKRFFEEGDASMKTHIVAGIVRSVSNYCSVV